MLINFPKLTILFGPNTLEKRAIAAAITDSNPDLWEAPIRDPIVSTGQIFYKNYPMPGDQDHWDQYFESFLRQHYGEDVLGRIFLKYGVDHGDFDMWENILIPDMEKPRDLEPIASFFKLPSIIVIHTGPITTMVGLYGCTSIVLAQPDNPGEALQQIARELSPVRA